MTQNFFHGKQYHRDWRYFNLPILLAKERGEFAKRGIEIEWTTFKGGTGQMARATVGIVAEGVEVPELVWQR